MSYPQELAKKGIVLCPRHEDEVKEEEVEVVKPEDQVIVEEKPTE